jgi:uncharacterized protein YbjT (DUF2867 family)
MLLLITGATGRLGRELAACCACRGWIVRAMSRKPAPAEGCAVTWATADLATGVGLQDALRDVEVVVHLASLAYRGRRTDAVDIGGTARLVDAAFDAGVEHTVFTSIVGVDAIPWPYFKKKLAAEELVRRGHTPWSIVRATQFYPLIDSVLRVAARLPVLFSPREVPGQPVDPRDVAEHIVAVIERGPSRRAVEFAGPEPLTFGELAAQWSAARGLRSRPLVPVPIPGALGRALRDGRAVPGGGEAGSRTWRSWLQSQYGSAANPTCSYRPAGR